MAPFGWTGGVRCRFSSACSPAWWGKGRSYLCRDQAYVTSPIYHDPGERADISSPAELRIVERIERKVIFNERIYARKFIVRGFANR